MLKRHTQCDVDVGCYLIGQEFTTLIIYFDSKKKQKNTMFTGPGDVTYYPQFGKIHVCDSSIKEICIQIVCASKDHIVMQIVCVSKDHIVIQMYVSVKIT
jgi:hypothetical protein